MNPKEIVRKGYDKVSHAYQGDEIDDRCALAVTWIEDLIALLQPEAVVLDLGCGCGVPASKMLAEKGFKVTGVDFSPVQITRARELVPNAAFICEDMVQLGLPAVSFDAVIALYAIIHVPLAEQPKLFADIRRWIKDGGYFLATVGSNAWTGTESDWLGVEGASMYWSHADKDTYRQMLADAGFAILWERFIPESDGGHVLILAQVEEDDE